MNVRNNCLLAGQSRLDITPQLDISMIGHGEGFFTGLKDRLYATAIVFSQGKVKVCLITADLVGFKADFTRDVQNRIAKQLGICKKNILLCATHTHRGPNVIWPLPANNNIRYIEELKAKLVLLASKANDALTEVSIGSAVGKAEIGINRRLQVNGKTEFLPNPFGLYDKDIMIVSIKSGKKLQGLITSHACHATVEPDLVISADYPGQVRDLLQQQYGNKPIISFLSGCCGDVRPNGPYKKEGWNLPINFQQIEDYKNSVVNAEKNILYNKNPILRLIHSKLNLPLDKERISLDRLEAWLAETVKHVKTEKITEANPMGGQYYLRVIKSLRKAIRIKKNGLPVRPISMDVAILQVGEIYFIFLPGEVFSAIGVQIKGLCADRTIIPISFYNVICPYICTATACAEGGFEPDISFPWSGQRYPFPFSGSCERIILEKVSSLFEQLIYQETGKINQKAKRIKNFNLIKD